MNKMNLAFMCTIFLASIAGAEVIDGRVAAQSEHQNVAQILFSTSPVAEATGSCTGTIVSDNTVITAAHCLLRIKKKSITPTYTYNLKVVFDSPTGKQETTIDQIVSTHFNSYYVEESSREHKLPGHSKQMVTEYYSNAFFDVAAIVFKAGTFSTLTNFPVINTGSTEIRSKDFFDHTYIAVGYGLTEKDIVKNYDEYQEKYLKIEEQFNKPAAMMPPAKRPSEKRIGEIKISIENSMRSGFFSSAHTFYDKKNNPRNIPTSPSQVAMGDSGGPLFNTSLELIAVASNVMPFITPKIKKLKGLKDSPEGSTDLKFESNTQDVVVPYQQEEARVSNFVPLYFPENTAFLEKLVKENGSTMTLKQ